MATRKARPFRFVPRGYSDTLDGTNSPGGACRALSDLISDPSTPGAFQCRPANEEISSFAGFSSPDTVSVAIQINNFVYGLIGTARNAGKDEPFCYNLPTNTFVTVGSVTNANTPTTQPKTGTWTPPSVTVMGPFIIFTHPGFNGVTNGFFGWLDVTTPATPVWHSGNTTTNGLTGVPTAVQLFSNRAYFAVDNTLQFTDALTLTRTNASQSITAGDTSPITALSPYTIRTTDQGIIQAILAFKDNTIFQITGDSASSNLAINSLNTAAGTVAPLSVVPTPKGIKFMAVDGIRMVDDTGNVSEPDEDARVPFINAVYPSRVTAAYNADIYRICVQNGDAPNTPFQDYWYDIGRGIWTGPHSFPYDIIVSWNDNFILFSHTTPGKMWRSFPQQNSQSTFIENSVQMMWNSITSPLPDSGDMMLASCFFSTVNLALSSNQSDILCVASDESGGVQSQGTIRLVSYSTIWGAFLWGAALWNAVKYGLRPHLIPWNVRFTFSKSVIQMSSKSALGFKISNLYIQYEPTKIVPSV